MCTFCSSLKYLHRIPLTSYIISGTSFTPLATLRCISTSSHSSTIVLAGKGCLHDGALSWWPLYYAIWRNRKTQARSLKTQEQYAEPAQCFNHNIRTHYISGGFKCEQVLLHGPQCNHHWLFWSDWHRLELFRVKVQQLKAQRRFNLQRVCISCHMVSKYNFIIFRLIRM